MQVRCSTARSNDLTHILGELRPDYLRDVLHAAIQFGCHNTTTINAALQQWCKSLDDTHVIRRTLVSLFHTGLDWPARLDAALHSQPTATAASASSDHASAARRLIGPRVELPVYGYVSKRRF